MTEITIRNKQLLKVLDDTIEKFLEHQDLMTELSYSKGDLDKVTPIGEGKKWTEPHTLQQFIDKGDKHTGFPENALGFQVVQGCESHPEIFVPLKNHTKEHLVQFFGASNNSLTSYYPPKGYVGWHTNWNAFAYQMILTWSETGDGYFTYYDKANDKFVVEEDKKGWQARHYRFGHYHEPEHHFWHAAWTECPRFTLAYKWKYFFNGMGEEGYIDEYSTLNESSVSNAKYAISLFVDELEESVDI